MKKWLVMILTAMLVLSSLSIVFADHDKGNGKSKDKGKGRKDLAIGIEVLLDEQKELIEGKNVGLITNPTGVDKELNSIVDLLHNDPDVNLTALYGPEHGVRGDAQAGQYVDYYIDEVTGLPVYSLYGKTRKPTQEMLEGIDVLVFDIQDVGTRFYTYIYTMALAMEAAKEKGIPFIVLDRPNPLGGTKVEGPVLDPEFASFVGQYAIPLRHGMTVGELAKLFNTEFGIDAELTVVEMEGWKRDSYFEETGLEFVPPSPNMPTVDTALVYPGTALIEGTNLSEGRGTTKPFEFIGAPFVNSTELAAELNALELPGVTFRAASFTPMFSKHSGKLSHGIQVHVTDRKTYKPVETGLHIVKTLHDLYPGQVELTAFFNNLIGNEWISEGIENGMTVEEMKERWQEDLNEFQKVRANYLLY
ncbi:exo-beta-N-acetylmuramidase NamZ domain-containing protein [Planomicrobium sp. CPCC 101079]|uniref:exo-beta-N-acetylmuramidase NamZ family protein n=1 Tax=Planomicrobium sp. CPCC 101079 TaxID=2599618 RepID=UPI0011B456D2|nr:DUF1343 domain-containing protein [Planomicrobium sp. CPCC 101079]TWT13313.1 DUF1343 domain-containing protein [Planomicrobium sp. CPCC 101079]